MSVGSTHSGKDSLMVAATNYPAPIIKNIEEVLQNCQKIASYIEGTKTAYPGLDLIAFPEYSTQSLTFNKIWKELVTTIPGPETEILAKACKENKVWGVFSIFEKNEDRRKNPYNTATVIDDQGHIAMVYRKVNPWVPLEHWYPGNGVPVCKGPKGSTLGTFICYDGQFPEVTREAAMKGADVLVRISAYMHPYGEQWSIVNRVRAFENMAYVVASCAAGRDDYYSYCGNSMIVNFDGTIISEASRGPGEVITGHIYPQVIKAARKEYASENHLYNIMHRGYAATRESGEDREGASECPYDFYKSWAKNIKTQKATYPEARST